MYFFNKPLKLQEGIIEVPHYFSNQSKQLVLIACANTKETLLFYVSALRAGHAVMLIEGQLNATLLQQIIKNYEPFYICGISQVVGYTQDGNVLKRNTASIDVIHPELAVLLSTSGTTGSPKFVRLSYENLQSNAEAIVQYLTITNKERAIVSLPISYSYGMSIINSHLQANAHIIITNRSVMEKEFWATMKEERVTSFAGVPFTYQMLRRIGFMDMDLPNLTTLTQAGGRLHEKDVIAFANYAQAHKKRFFVMYGQTEAAPRMSYIPYEKLLDKVGTIGIPIPGGIFDIDAETGELIYRGANVMMGYATCKEDLAKGDECEKQLFTGDVATVDEDGYYTIVGRLKRFIKLYGLRINLDEVEKQLEGAGFVTACIGSDDKMLILTEGEERNIIKQLVQEWYKLHNTAFKIKSVDALSRLPNGKLDYKTMKELYE